MRIKIDQAPAFPLTLNVCELEIYKQYKMKYDQISDILDQNPAVLNAFHTDLSSWGSGDGRESTYSSEQFLRILIIKCLEGLSLRDVIIRVADSAILRNFARIFSGTIMNFTMLDTAFKKITPQTWEKINTLIAKYAKDDKHISGDTLRVDSTVCESNIHYPTDASLLWDSYRVTSRLIGYCAESDARLDLGNRFHHNKVKKLYTFIATQSSRKNDGAKRAVRTRTKALLHQVRRVAAIAVVMLEKSKCLPLLSDETNGLLMVLKDILVQVNHVILQSQRVINGETVPAVERIFSIFEPHTELLKRGKAYKPVEFGHMVTIGQVESKFISYYNVEEVSRHDIKIGDDAKNAHKIFWGEYPAKFTADKNYYAGPEHTEKWESKIDQYSVGKKGKKTQEEYDREHAEWFQFLQKFRAGCEGSISVLKRVFGLRRCLFRSFKSFASSIGCLVFCHNLVILSKL